LDFLTDKLSPFERPKQIEFRDSLLLSLIGKPSRRAPLAHRETNNSRLEG
jgi:hypothetical protein